MGEGGGTAAEELLERLVEQFASPYDFLRELVQNAMDAGSDRVDVELHVHRDGDDDEVVFEIAVADAGSGMDQQCIDAELTRLFASSKRLDRTMAGGFGVGFVSIFAWAPACVLVQTGCRGEAWEIEFDAQRRFTRRKLVDPIEGTTVRSFKAGRASEADAIAEQVRASLWRWCRFCRVDLGFTYAGKHERIHEEPPPDDEALAISHRAADTYVRVEFGEPAKVVLRRHGLVLAEGTPAVHLPAELRASWPHLQVWADSPALS
ncbi:MAG TPA: ATP-binding protein, partial [Nannocystaceae bacterium]|nr:ATP-binding protein [Nannocystaceae bacterium]